MNRSRRICFIGFMLFLLLGLTYGQSSVAQTPPPDAEEMGPYAPLSGEDEQCSPPNVDQCFTPPALGVGVELRSKFYYPDDIPQRRDPVPLVILLHGKHVTCMNGTANPPVGLAWPCSTLGSGWVPIPSYKGYDDLGMLLASRGYIVVSVSANGINRYDDERTSDGGALARSQLVEKHLSQWERYNSTDEVPRPPEGEPLPDGFFRGKVDMQNIGLMGHSRGGEGVAYLATLGSRTGIKAVLALAPTDFLRLRINSNPYVKPALGVLLPYCDGDVADLQGVHYYDDARYNITFGEGLDPRPKHTFLMMGANHNYFNLHWSGGTPTPGQPTPVPGGVDDWSQNVLGTPLPTRVADSYCGSGTGNGRLSQDRQRTAGRMYMSAFFRVYLGGEIQLNPLLIESRPVETPLPVATVYPSYHTANNSGDMRKDVNRLTQPSSINTNDLGGQARSVQLAPYEICGGSVSQHCLPGEAPPGYDFHEPRQPHTADAFVIPPKPLPSPTTRPGLSQLSLGWRGNVGQYINEIPAGRGNISIYETLQFRVAVNFKDALNQEGVIQDFNVVLRDGSNPVRTAVVPVEAAYQNVPNPLFYPPGSKTFSWPHPVPHAVLNTVRIPLTRFTAFTANPQLDLSNIRVVEFQFGRRAEGALLVSDLAFTNRLCPLQTPVPGPTPCATTNYEYRRAPIVATIVPGSTDIGNHCDDCTTTINLPFAVRLYDGTFTTAIVGSNGTLGFTANSNYFTNECLPRTSFNNAILPYWDDLRTDVHDNCPTGGCGIFTSVSGTSPNRIFNIEWRTIRLDYPNPPVNFEVRLYEGEQRRQFDIIYGETPGGESATIGVQRGTGSQFTQFSCNTQDPNGLDNVWLTFTQPQCSLSSCPYQFQDTQQYVNIFSSHIQCLACRGLVSGYTCGGPGEPCVCSTTYPYFRPFNNVTRGQLSKIVSNAAGFNEDPGGQIFSDVRSGDTFYDFINRLARREIISGYADGTFRPNNPAKRGHIAKIVSNAAGYIEDPGGQMFTDVPSHQTFYKFINRLARRGIMNGYNRVQDCPTGVPCFLPENDTTRGQMSKVAANAFFPNCNAPVLDAPEPVPTEPVDAIPLPVPTQPAP